MSELREALSRFEVSYALTNEGTKGTFVVPATMDDVLEVFEAASRWDALTSPETIEKAFEYLRRVGWTLPSEVIEGVLRAVTEGEQ